LLVGEKGYSTHPNVFIVLSIWQFFFFFFLLGQPRTIDIIRPLNEFTNMVKSWRGYDKRKMGIAIEDLKRIHLPIQGHQNVLFPSPISS
jgi:poly(A) polymerase Pap1